MKEPVDQELERCELIGPLNPGHFYPTLDAALEHLGHRPAPVGYVGR